MADVRSSQSFGQEAYSSGSTWDSLWGACWDLCPLDLPGVWTVARAVASRKRSVLLLFLELPDNVILRYYRNLCCRHPFF